MAILCLPFLAFVYSFFFASSEISKYVDEAWDHIEVRTKIHNSESRGENSTLIKPKFSAPASNSLYSSDPDFDDVGRRLDDCVPATIPNASYEVDLGLGTITYTCAAGYYGNVVTVPCSDTNPLVICQECGNSLSLNANTRLEKSGYTLKSVCLAGYYTDNIGSLTCDPITGAITGTQSVCKPCYDPVDNHYCTGGLANIRNTCVPGSFYIPMSTPSVETCGGLCQRGYYCPVGSTSATENECGSAAVYCPAGSTAPVPVPANWYSCNMNGALCEVSGVPARRSAAALCPVHRDCVGGEIMPFMDKALTCPVTSVTVEESTASVPLVAIEPFFKPTVTTGNIKWAYNLIRPTGCMSSISGKFTATVISGKQHSINGVNLVANKCLGGTTLKVNVSVVAQAAWSYPRDDLWTECDIPLTILQKPKPPTLTCTAMTVKERDRTSNVLGKITATNNNEGTELTYKFEGVDETEPFSIGPCDGQVSIVGNVRYIHKNVYTYLVNVTNNGALAGIADSWSTCSLTINVQRVPYPPTITNSQFFSDDLRPANSLLGCMIIKDLDDYPITKVEPFPAAPQFRFDLDGCIYFAEQIDTLKIQRSTWTPQMCISTQYRPVSSLNQYCRQITIQLNAVPRRPTLMPQGRNISELAPVGTFISEPIHAYHVQNLTIEFMSAYEFGAVSENFGITNDGYLYLLPTRNLDFAVREKHYVSVTVQVVGNSTLSATETMNVSIIEQNKPPYWLHHKQVPVPVFRYTIEELAPRGKRLNGTAMTALDPNVRELLTYSVTSCSPTLPIWSDAFSSYLSISTGVDVETGFIFNPSQYSLDPYPSPPFIHTCNMRVQDTFSPPYTANTSFEVEIIRILPRWVDRPFYHISTMAPAGAYVTTLSDYSRTFYNANDLRYSIVKHDLTHDGDQPFAVDPITGVVTVTNIAGNRPNLNINFKDSYTVLVRTTDININRHRDANITIELWLENRAPFWNSTATFYTPAEKRLDIGRPLSGFVFDYDFGMAPVGCAICEEKHSFSIVGGNTDNIFGIDNDTGQLTVVNEGSPHFIYPSNAASPPQFDLTVRVTDIGVNNTAPFYADGLVKIILLHNNESLPVVPDKSYSIQELSPVGTVVGNICGTGNVGANLTYSIEWDGVSLNNIFPLAIRQKTVPGHNFPCGEIYIINHKYGPCNASPLEYYPTAACRGRNFIQAKVFATDKKLDGTQFMGFGRVTVNITHTLVAPWFDSRSTTATVPPTYYYNSATFTLSVKEHSPVGTSVFGVKNITAISKDPDQNVPGVMQYTWVTAGASNLFSLNSNTGAVTVAPTAGDLNFHIQSLYTFTVRVTDGHGQTDTATVRIEIQDVNDPPTFDGRPDAGLFTTSNTLIPSRTVTISEGAPMNTTIAIAKAYDIDTSVLWGTKNYAIQTGPYSDYFAIDRVTGRIYVSHLAAFDWNFLDTFTLTITCKDNDIGKELTASMSITINLTQINRVTVTNFARPTGPVDPKLIEVGVNPLYPAAQYPSIKLLYPTDGGTIVAIHGTGFGKTQARLDREGLSISSTVVTATYGPTGVEYTATGCQVVVANTVVHCKTVASVGAKHAWKININGQWPSPPSLLYTGNLAPAITSIYIEGTNPANPAEQLMNTSGIQSGATQFLIVEGENFGPSFSVIYNTAIYVDLLYGPTAFEYRRNGCTWITEHKKVKCAVVPGVGKSLLWTISAGEQRSPHTPLPVRYANPLISGVISTLFSTQDSQTFEIVGENFGPASSSGISAVYSKDSTFSTGGPNPVYTALSCTVPASDPHTKIRCRSVPGVGLNLAIRVTVAAQNSAAYLNAVGYKAPVITQLFGPGVHQGSTEGGGVVFISGTDFGPLTSVNGSGEPIGPYAPVVVYGKHDGVDFTGPLKTANRCRVITAHQRIQCLTVEGTGVGYRWKIQSIGGQDSGVFLDTTTSYHPPIVALYSGPGSVNAETEGNQQVIITGRNFGPAGTPIDSAIYGLETIAHFDAQDCEITVPHFEIICETNVGAGTGLTWTITIDGQSSVAPATWYGAPEVYSFSGPGAVDASTRGGQEVIITGDYFSIDKYLDSVTYGPFGDEYQAQNCTVTVDHTEIRCLTVPGTGRALHWIVTVGGQSSLPSDAHTSYAVPNIFSISPVRGPTAGGTRIRILATNAALLFDRADLKVMVNANQAVQPGKSPIDPLAFLIDMNLAPKYNPTPDMSPEVLAYWEAVYNASPVPPLAELVPSWLNDLQPAIIYNKIAHANGTDEIVFIMPDGFGTNVETFLMLNGVPSNLVNIEYNPPLITNIAPDRQHNTPGFLRVFIEGQNFCRGTVCGRVLVNNNEVPIVSYSNTQILITAPDIPDNSIPQEARVVVHGLPSNVAFFRKPAPNFSEQAEQGEWINMNTQGGEVMFIAGVLEIHGEDVTITVGGRECTDQTREAEFPAMIPTDPMYSYKLTCVTPPGIGTRLPILLSTIGGTSRVNEDLLFSYAPPHLDNLYLWPVGHPLPSGRRLETLPEGLPVFELADSLVHGTARLPTTGGYIVITGSNFGTADLVDGDIGIEIFLNNIIPVEIVFHSHTYLIINVPAFGGGTSNSLSISVASSPSINLLTFKAELPRLMDISPLTGPTVGGTFLTLTGANFGTSVPSIKFRSVDNVEKPCALVTPFVPSSGHDTIQCITPNFEGMNVNIIVTVEGQESLIPGAPKFNYIAPQVMDVSPEQVSTSGRELGALLPDGVNREIGPRVEVVVTGTNFGTRGRVEIVDRQVLLNQQYNDPLSGTPYYMIPVPNIDVLSWSDTTVVFYAQEGVGTNLNIVIYAGNQPSLSYSNHLDSEFGYEPPTLTSWTRVDRSVQSCKSFTREYDYLGQTFSKLLPAQCYDTRGDYEIKLIGLSFSKDIARTSVTIGGRAAFIVELDHHQMRVRVPQGQGDYQLIGINVRGQTLDSDSPVYFHYDPPIVDVVIPNTPDALGQLVTFRGKNFGFEPTAVAVNVSDAIGWHMVEDAKYGSDATLQFYTQNSVVGTKQLALYVANRTEPTMFYMYEQFFVTECKRDYTGLDGEYCLPCPRGAFCPGSEHTTDLTYALPGFWKNYVTNPSDLCPAEHRDPQFREMCYSFVACSPPESCLGANTCSEGYEGERCAYCLAGKYYRVNGECIKCPDSPIAVLIAFIALALFGVFVSYFLTKYNVTITLLTVGLDYAQVISIFARTKVKWPPEIMYIFKFLSAFNFNIEIAAPECLLENVTFLNKWLAIELLPLIALVFLFGIFGVKFFYKLLCLSRKRDSLYSHLPQMLSVFIVTFRVLYLFLTRSAMDVFSCSPTIPPDGKEYMAGMLEVVCYESGSVHMTLLPLAVVAVIIYVVGFPISGFVWIWKNKSIVKHDQILRAKNWGDDRRTNPQFYSFRKSWHKLYYHFKPGKWYWEAIIIGRKFFIAFISLMFRQTPDYQLAMALLVLFVAYVLHVKSYPYLTNKNKHQVLEEHRRKAAEGHPLHKTIELDLRIVEKTNRLQAKSGKMTRLGDVQHFDPKTMSPADIALHGLFDHNTVEAVLLACAVLVNLAGIMFNSARFQGDMAQYYEEEYKSLTYATIVLIGASLVYYVLVLFADVLTSVSPALAARMLTCGKVEAAIMRAKARRQGKSNPVVSKGKRKNVPIDTTGISLQMSQLFQQTRLDGINESGITEADLMTLTAPPGPVEWLAIRAAFIDNIQAVNGLQRQVYDYKRSIYNVKHGIDDTASLRLDYRKAKNTAEVIPRDIESDILMEKGLAEGVNPPVPVDPTLKTFMTRNPILNKANSSKRALTGPTPSVSSRRLRADTESSDDDVHLPHTRYESDSEESSVSVPSRPLTPPAFDPTKEFILSADSLSSPLEGARTSVKSFANPLARAAMPAGNKATAAASPGTGGDNSLMSFANPLAKAKLGGGSKRTMMGARGASARNVTPNVPDAAALPSSVPESSNAEHTGGDAQV